MSTHKLVRILVFVFTFIGFIILSSCTAPAPALWMQVSDIPFDYVMYDSGTRTIWLEEFTKGPSDAIYKVDHINADLSFGISKKIALPNNSLINSICASNGIWVSSFVLSETPSLPFGHSGTSTPDTIYRYMDNTKSWQMVGVTSNPARCKSLKDGDVILWQQNEIIRFDSKHAQPQYIKINQDIADITDDLGGNLWVCTVNGEIYSQSQNDWILIDTLGSNLYPTLFVDNSGNLWATGRGKYIYEYLASNSKPLRKKVFESSLGIRQDFFQDNSGAIWVVTNERLLVQKEGQFQDVVLPPRDKFIRFGFYDDETNTLFVSTAKGVFALDLSKMNK